MTAFTKHNPAPSFSTTRVRASLSHASSFSHPFVLCLSLSPVCSDHKPAGSFPLHGCTVNLVDTGETSQQGRHRNGLKLITQGRTYLLQAETEEDMVDWIGALSRAAYHDVEGAD